MLKRLNDALPGLVLGIIFYGIAIELVGVWFVSDKLRFTSGLMIGIVTAIGMAIHMAVVLLDAVDFAGAEKAKRRIVAKSILRYVVVVVIFLVMMIFHLGSLFSAFLGVMGLKASAYMQPLMHKAFMKMQGRGDVSPDNVE